MRRTLPDTGARVTAVGASVLLDVKRATTFGIRQYSCSFVLQTLLDSSIPQRLHRTCVLLWRLPKLDVPFAVHALRQPPISPSIYSVFGGGCVLIVSVLGEGHWSGPSVSSSLV